jgi:hypothetical protein
MKTAETLAENAAAFVADFLTLVAERDAAQQMVAEMQDLLECWNPCGCKHPACNFCLDDKRVAKLLQRVLYQP